MISDFLKEHIDYVENEIDRLFPSISNVGCGDFSVVCEASRYSLTLGGKRIRPIILLEFCKLLGGKREDAINFAVALEMIHTYSLIHDDLPCMDNDDMRRGKPSCHIKYGEDTALLAGDTLLTEAFGVMAKANLPSERVVKAVEFLSSLSGLHGMIGGQVLDLQFEKTNPTAEQLIDMYSRKTGGLLIAAATLGCIAAGKFDQKTIENAKNYACEVGLAFQIIDDILDCTADEKVLGKPVGSDEKNSKTTFVTIYGIEKSREIAARYTESALNALNKFEGDKTNLIALTEYLLKRNY